MGCIYRPPSTSLADINTFTACLKDSIEKIGSAKDPLHKTHIALIGDFNATSPKWCTTDKYNCAGRLVEDTFLRMGLHQFVDFPTHIHPDGSFGSLLDLFLVSSDKMISDILSLPPLGKSDHISPLCNLNLRKDTPPKATHLTVRGKTIWCYERANHDVVSQALKKAFTDTWNLVRNAESIKLMTHGPAGEVGVRRRGWGVRRRGWVSGREDGVSGRERWGGVSGRERWGGVSGRERWGGGGGGERWGGVETGKLGGVSSDPLT